MSKNEKRFHSSSMGLCTIFERGSDVTISQDEYQAFVNAKVRLSIMRAVLKASSTYVDRDMLQLIAFEQILTDSEKTDA